MEHRHIIERAFELAPLCNSLDDLARKLDREGYPSVHAHLKSPTLRGQLKKLFNPALG